MGLSQKPFRLIAPWPHYTDISGGVQFIDSVSEPVTETDARRIAAAMGCTVVAAESISPDAWEGIAPGPDDAAIAVREEVDLEAPGTTDGVAPPSGAPDAGPLLLDTPAEPAARDEAEPGSHSSAPAPEERASRAGGRKTKR